MKRLFAALTSSGFAFALTLSIVACDDDAQFTARSAPDFAPAAKMTVSVVGLYKDGILTDEGWDAMGQKLAPSLHGGKCEIAFGDAHLKKDPALSQAIDDYARSNGVTDELLGALAPIAKGDVLLLVTRAGRVAAGGDGGAGAATFFTGTPTPRAIRGGGRPQQQRSTTPSAPKGTFELAVSFFSLKTHASVALLSMKYTGSSEDEAYKLFNAKLAQFAPQLTCAGFDDAVHIDEAQIRALSAPPTTPL